MGRAHGRSGGGIEQKNTASYSDSKREPIVHAVSPGAVSRLGEMVGVGTPHKSLYNFTKTSSPFGATDNTLAGPGANRTVMKAGSQSTTPPARSMPKGRPSF
jgi:hypothetical protein